MNNKAIQGVLMLLASGIALGQQPSDSPKPTITGTVIDASGAVIVDAKVSLFRNTDGALIAVTNTDDRGEFQFISRGIQEFKLVAEANCFQPTTVEGIAVKADGRTEFLAIILQVRECSGDAVEPIPVPPDPSEVSKSLEPSKTVKVVTVCELFESLNQYNNTAVAVVGRLDKPGDKLSVDSGFLVQGRFLIQGRF